MKHVGIPICPGYERVDGLGRGHVDSILLQNELAHCRDMRYAFRKIIYTLHLNSFVYDVLFFGDLAGEIIRKTTQKSRIFCWRSHDFE